MSIPLEGSASQETVWDFDVSILGIPNLTLQNSAQLGALRSPPVTTTAQLQVF